MEPPSSVLVPTPPPSPNHRTATWASDSSTVRQWTCVEAWTCLTEEASFFRFPCHSTSYNMICWKCFLKQSRKLLLDLLSKSRVGEKQLFPPKETEEDKQREQLKLVMLRLEDQTLLISVCTFPAFKRTCERKWNSYSLSVGAGEQSKCWCGCLVCSVLSHSVTVAPSFTTCECCFTLRLFSFRSNLRLHVQVAPRACMSTLMTQAYIKSFCKKGFKTWLNN